MQNFPKRRRTCLCTRRRECGCSTPPLPDSYKFSQQANSYNTMYPKNARQMSAYGSFRSGYKGENTNKVLFYGYHFVRRFVEHVWTLEDVEELQSHMSTFGIGGKSHPFPDELFTKIVNENNGYFPVKLQVLPEATVVYAGTPVYQITASGEYSRLVTYLETCLTHIYYPCVVATYARLVRDDVEKVYAQTVDDQVSFTKKSRLHDFGGRATTNLEQSIIGGSAQLISFEGSDTIAATKYVQDRLNDGEPYACSLPASEHANTTSFPTEEKAVETIVDMYKDTFFATVADSVDYLTFFERIFARNIKKVEEAGGFWNVRPDSGDPRDAVLFGLNELKKYANYTINSKGYIVFSNCSIVQGDSLDRKTIQEIYKLITENGYAASNVVFGMGGKLLQNSKDRGTMDFSTKLSYIIYEDGTEKEVMKAPTGDSIKISLPGRIDVCLNENGFPQTYPESVARDLGLTSLFVTVWDSGPVGYETPKFTDIVKRADEEWNRIPEGGDPFHESMKLKSKRVLEQIRNL